jgi:2-methylaconitate cis-trans-isomerase PrpF
MNERSYPAVFMRGGDASGLFFHLKDIPDEGAQRDHLLIKAMGSPDPYGMQIDGLGKGTTSTSKCVMVSKSIEQGCDIDYLFAQVLVERPEVDWKRSCGNLAAATALFAVEEGLVPESQDGQYSFVMNQVNRGEIIRTSVDSNTKEVKLSFENKKKDLSPILGPLPTFEILLPEVGAIELSIIEATNIFAFVRSVSIETDSMKNGDFLSLKKRVDALQEQIAKELSIDGHPLKARVLLVDPPMTYTEDLFLRAISGHGIHHAIPMTAVMAASVGALIPGTILAAALQTPIKGNSVRVGHPSGVATASPQVSKSGTEPRFLSADIELSARRIMSGEIFI